MKTVVLLFRREVDVANTDISPPSVKDVSASPDVESETKGDDNLDEVNVDEFSETEDKVETSKPVAEPGNEAHRDANLKGDGESQVSQSDVDVESCLTSKDEQDETIVDVNDSCHDTSAQLSTSGLSDNELDVVSVPVAQLTSEPPLTLEEVPCTTPVHQPILSPVSVAMASEHNYFSTHETPPRRRKDHRVSASLSKQLPIASDDANSLPCNLPVLVPSLHPDVEIDHNYCQRFHTADESQLPMDDSLPFSEVAEPSVVIPYLTTEPVDDAEPVKEEPKHPKSRAAKPRSHKLPLLADIANVSGSRELAGLFSYVPPRPRPQFPPRDYQQEMRTAYDFLIGGIDQEDVQFLKRRYEELLQDDSMQTYWLNDTHWVDHPTTFAVDALAGPPPGKKRKMHHEGCVSKHLTGQFYRLFAFSAVRWLVVCCAS